jgi:membrane protein DedA with SNARE-associated domain
MLNAFIVWLLKYKGIALFLLLALGIVGLPIPDETLMTFAGVYMAKNELSFVPTLFAAYAGSLIGITVSYLIGRTAGAYLVRKYGPRFGLTQERIDRVHRWFEKIGKWTLLVGYFVPGVRHLTGYVAGTTELSFMQFAIFAYTGAILWCTLFLSFGYFSGQHLDSIIGFIIENIDNLILFFSVVGLLIFGLYWWYGRKKREHL